MEILKYCKMQIGFLVILIFISYLFVKDGNHLNKKTGEKRCNPYFDKLYVLAEIAIFFDGVTFYTVNHLGQISETVNILVHLAYMLSYQIFIFMHFMYWLSATDSIPKVLWKKICYYIPIFISGTITIFYIPKLHYVTGEYSNYSIGISAYACFGAIAFYSVLTLIVFFRRTNYIQRNKRTTFILDFIVVSVITVLAGVFHQALISSIGDILIVIVIYLCLENPSIKYLEFYHEEMVMGFATLVESKDGSTGGHIRRSSAYAVLIANRLRNNPKYKKIITRDYIDNLRKAAPMHDIGKIGIPDDILQKPGKLTDEEFDIMKTHPEIGGKIIEETFGHLDHEEYKNMAYNVAMSHHEKWNGRGYPAKLKEEEIPLCARIMAVADVFDAVSAKRCYRDAMPLEKCYQIIKEGREKDFDPDIVDAFFAVQEEVEAVYYKKISK